MPNHVHFILEIISDQICYKLSSKPATFANVVGAFKSKSKTFCTKQKLEFEWQQNYHEHIIRTEKDQLYLIRKYQMISYLQIPTSIKVVGLGQKYLGIIVGQL
jgi:REP element-mobilizing transposase RayT